MIDLGNLRDQIFPRTGFAPREPGNGTQAREPSIDQACSQNRGLNNQVFDQQKPQNSRRGASCDATGALAPLPHCEPLGTLTNARIGAYTLLPLPSIAGSLSGRRCGRLNSARMRRSDTDVANPKGRLQPVDLAHELYLQAELRRVVTKLLPLRFVRVLVELELRYLAQICLLILTHAYRQLCLHVGL
eukprot:scaffold105799_cov36-Phaeocystis_antarctica.AAC.1